MKSRTRQGPEESVRGPGVVIHHLNQIVELSAILYGQLPIRVHIQEVVVDHPIVAETKSKTVHLQ